jgi:ATP-dependent Clp protease ATP-binding subunit ClpA
MAKVQADLRQLPADQQELRRSLMMNGYNFTERVRKVLALAREEASELQYEYVGTEHILLGMIREGASTATAVMTNFGVNGQELRSHVLELAKPARTRWRPGPDLPYTSRAKKTLEYAMTEARGFNHSYVGTEHLLLGILREGKGLAAQALNSAGITLDDAREETLRVLDGAAGRRSPRQSQRGFRESLASYPQRLREVMADAHDIAAERGSIDVTPAHATIALLEHRDGMANTALDRLSFDHATALFALSDLAPHLGSPVSPDAVMTPSPELAVALLAAEAEQRDAHASVPGTHHILLGLLAACADVAAVFEAQGFGYEVVREEIRRGTG